MTTYLDSTVVVIPAFNEEATIGAVIRGLSNFGGVFVINDGSSDDTAVLAKENGAKVFDQPQNMGYDAALLRGLREARTHGFEYLVFVDADGQHNPADAEQLAKLVLTEGTEIGIAHRPKAARFSEAVFKIIAYKRYGIVDILCGMKVFKISCLAEFENMMAKETYGTLCAVAAVSQHKNLSQIPIQNNNREDKPRIGRLFIANIKIFKAMFVTLSYQSVNAGVKSHHSPE